MDSWIQPHVREGTGLELRFLSRWASLKPSKAPVHHVRDADGLFSGGAGTVNVPAPETLKIARRVPIAAS
jgi:hypothetical protein